MSLPSEEQWRPVVGYEGTYEVSDLGRVRSLDRVITASGAHGTYQKRIKGHVLAGIPRYVDRDTGRRCVAVAVNLKRNGTACAENIHKLVMAAFVGPRPPGAEVCHREGDARDNRLANLHYGTPADNALDRVRHGVHNQARKTHCPRGHQLAEPNLVAHQWRKGHRSCLACHRATAYKNFSQRRGSDYDLAAGSHEYYARIMAGCRQPTSSPGALSA